MRNTGHSTEQSPCDQEQAAILAVGLRLGLVERHEVIAWADQQILATDEPSLRLIDLADMREAHSLDVWGALSALASGRSELDALPAALARYTYRLREAPKLRRGVARVLSTLVSEARYDVPAWLDPAIGLDASYDLAASGTWGTVAEADAELLAFCERFEPGGASKPDEPIARNPPDPRGLTTPMFPYPRELHRCPECATPVHEADAYCSSCGVEFTPEHRTIMQAHSTAALRREVLVVLAAGAALALLWWALS